MYKLNMLTPKLLPVFCEVQIKLDNLYFYKSGNPSWKVNVSLGLSILTVHSSTESESI